MSTTGHRKGVLPKGDWLAALCRDGYHPCNLGPLTDEDLVRIARELTRLDDSLVPSRVLQVRSVPGTPDLTLTSSEIPFHTDGTFRREPPHHVLLYCPIPSSRGGETLFVRGDQVVARLDPETRTSLTRSLFHIQLGAFSAKRRLLRKHPRDGTPVLLFGDPAISSELKLAATGKVPVDRVLDVLRAILRHPDMVCYRHRWKRHDLLVFDNYKVLHGRTRYRGDRLLKRVEMSPEADDIQFRSDG
jgi:alpha-ketoglutarate-dependent taurine dioxygenase